MRRVTIASALAIILLLSTGLSSVLAIPANNPHAEQFSIQCDDGQTYDILVARGLPGHIVDSNQKLIPQVFTFEVVVDDAVVYEETSGPGQGGPGQKKGLQDRLITCNLEFPASDEDIQQIEEELGIDLSEAEEVILRVTIQAFITPARR